MPSKRVLIVDDEPNMRDVLQDVFTDDGMLVDTAQNGCAAVLKLEKDAYDLAIVDLRLPDMSGIDVMREIRRRNSQTVIIMVTAYSTVDTAIEAMKLGAYDYVTKPFKIDKLKKIVVNALAGADARGGRLARDASSAEGFDGIIGASPEVRQIFEMVADLAPTNATVLIYGESGTGKELLARYIHRQSLRADKPFIKVNCAAIPETLLESELFGHEKGAFTNAIARRPGRFEVADGGTIFLDEIGEMSLAMQAKLLRVLQEKEFERVGGTDTIRVDVRIISATNRDLREAIRQRAFREDLYYRLNVVPLTLPPLRRRKGDILALSERFINKYAKETGKQVTGVSREALEVMMRYDWPGNIRELENCIERAVILAKGQEILPENLFLGGEPINKEEPVSGEDELVADSVALSTDPVKKADGDVAHEETTAGLLEVAASQDRSGCGEEERSAAEPSSVSEPVGATSAPDLTPCSLEELEKAHIIEVLRQTEGNRTEAAKILKITRRTLLNKIKRYSLS